MTEFSIPSRAGTPASACRIPLDTWLRSQFIRDPIAVQRWWFQQVAAALQSIEAEVSSWDDVIWSLGNSAVEQILATRHHFGCVAEYSAVL